MLEPRLRPLVRKRVRLAQALLEGSPLNEIQSPARVAQLLIGVMAPYVREMGRRSPVAGELVLKRQVEDGRREELFISIHELTDKFATLTPERQAFFNEYGLVYDVQESGSGETTEEPEVSSRAAMPARVSGEISARGRVSSGAVAAAAPACDVQSKG